MSFHRWHYAGTMAAVLVASAVSAATPQARCAALGDAMKANWPEAGTRLTSSVYRAAGPAAPPPGPPGMPAPVVQLPAHCDVTGIMHERHGSGGQNYAIRFHVRLPADWNGRFFFQGGGGTNGELGEAIGRLGAGLPPALAEGYAVLSQDSGHDNATNSVPALGGPSAFGFDAQARADYGGASLRPATLAARAVVQRFYGSAPKRSYFFGCSKGGQEGMALAQRDPALFDGIVAAAPGFALPRAAVAEIWDTQSFAAVVKASGQPVTLASLAASFSMADFGLVRTAVLDACDAADGLRDGLVGAFRQCTTAKVKPALARATCTGAKRDGCLSAAQVTALERIHQGPRNSKGEQLYPGFPWDAGWADMGWRIWKIGTPDGSVPPLNVAMGAPSLATVFTTPPQPPGSALQAYLDYSLRFDFDRDAPAIYATSAAFPRSAWEVISARSPDLAAFRRRGGKLIVPHGVSDPVFSIDDTIAWWTEVDARNGGQAASFTRVFPVPGMAHCSGGPATDQYDMLGALVQWVEHGKAPDHVTAAAGPATPWPKRTRPLCPYPLVARPVPGKADAETAASFACART